MAVRSIPLKTWRKFLKSRGLKKIRTKGGHEYWDKPDDSLIRPVAFSAHFKEISGRPILTNLNTMGCTIQDLEKYLGRK